MDIKRISAVLALGSAMIVSGFSVAAGTKAVDKPATKPAEEKKTEATPSTVKLTKPWSELATLSEEQKEKIEKIHKKALAEESTIEKKEKEDIMDVLSDAQKAELKEIAGKKRKDAAAARKASADAADKKSTESGDTKSAKADK